ncbi:nitrite reductase, copper-containing [Candidatus Kaiserbacteria bacterium CG10_big_fil_rev_8_21_14_0_10_45_20]|uniref:Copper-containing nitrite reductase n=1 Tax=Candidatus Kaiserbacteria bacterium CG10_big_fil_rev_8_21_14_0_10_45_20 TaxID=1974607 RepID=A0A2H0UGD6_9BACT|nr:MAG: nitrite reductase, copper-containing [Candidatus Kaiserbacteria bacterium CG10_big_fil_rev_8_21_14_0_10_45_20]
MDLISYLWQYIVEVFGIFIAYIFAGIFIYLILRRFNSRAITLTLLAVFVGVSISFYIPNGLPNAFQYPFFMKTFGPVDGPVLPFSNVVTFLSNFNTFERVDDIARDPHDVPTDIVYAEDGAVEIEITAKEVVGTLADGITFNYWTFDGKVPGPFLRVREGDTVRLTLHNDESSIHHHNIDLHAVTGPGGGASATNVAPGESKTITFKALNPGLFMYHCAHPNVANHNAHGMYGMILVEPQGGLPDVDVELYVIQGEFYTSGGLGRKGLQLFDPQAMLDGKPQYVLFNGRVSGETEHMHARVGDTIRMYVGNGGVNLISSFHLIGEIFDRVYREGDLVTPPAQSIQTTLIPAGGATVVEFEANYPGKYILVDHALSRVERGAWRVLEISGDADPSIFDGDIEVGHGH